MLKKLTPCFGLFLMAVTLLAACSPAPATTPAPSLTSPTVVQSATETQAPPTAAAATSTPAAPTPTTDPSEAIKPVFAASAHANATAAAFTTWDTAKPQEVPTLCARCHTSAGFQEYIASGKVAKNVAAPAGTLECKTCHNDTANQLTSVTFPSGVTIDNLGPEARCMTCHQGRESKLSVDKQISDFKVKDVDAVVKPTKGADGKEVDFGFRNVHYFAAGGTLYAGQVHMGYEYDGNLYDIKTRHVEGMDTCLGCHDQHSLQVKIDKCSQCHTDVKSVADLQNIREPSSSKDYNGNGDAKEGIALEIKGLQASLLNTIQNYANEVAGAPVMYDPQTYPYWFTAAKDGSALKDKSGSPLAYSTWTARMLKAAYNYQVSIKDPGAFAHGGKYIIELLYDSMSDLNAADKLKTKTDMSKMVREDAGHFDGASPAWRHWDQNADKIYTYQVDAACARCHTPSGLPLMLQGQPASVQPAGNGLMCATCHDTSAMPARKTVKDVTLPSGKVVSFGDGADSNLCIECHQARASKQMVDKQISDYSVTDADAVVGPIKVNGADQAFSFINSHYLGVAGIWFGNQAQIAYEYDGKTYTGPNAHPPADGKNAGCVGCHDVHAGTVKIELCQNCHTGVKSIEEIRGLGDSTDWNGNGDAKEGIQAEFQTFQDDLLAGILKYAKAKAGSAIVYDAGNYPYWFTDANGNGKHDADEKPFATWTARLLKAAYNYNYLYKTTGSVFHNARYAMQIAYDSINDLGGDVSKLTRP